MPVPTIQKAKTHTQARSVSSTVEWCYCHACKYEVLCEPCDLPDDRAGPTRFVPRADEEDAEWCYCHMCKYEVLCAPWDVPGDRSGPIVFAPREEEIGS